MAHAHLLHPVWISNQQVKKLVSLLTISLIRPTCMKARSQKNLLPLWRWLVQCLLENLAGWSMTAMEPSYYRPLHQVTTAIWFLYRLSKKLVFVGPWLVLVKTAYLELLALNSQRYSTFYLEVKLFPLMSNNRQTTINITIMMISW